MSYQRAQERNRRLRKLYEETRSTYGAGAYIKDNRLCRYSCHDKDLKTTCRRSTRRRLKQQDTSSAQKSGYKRLFDYWWELL
jgi:hypothetical protein